MIDMALNGHFRMQIPQPLQSVSKMVGFFSPCSILIASIRLLTIGQNLIQTVPQSSGLQRSLSRIAIRTNHHHFKIVETILSVINGPFLPVPFLKYSEKGNEEKND
jgi:hypothetical protein